MVKFLKPGKVVILLNGKHAGRKAVIVKQFDDGFEGRKYGHAIVAGVAKAPLKVTKRMSRRKVHRRSRVKPFLKVVNNTHIMPTRYNVDVDLKSVGITNDIATNPSKRVKARVEIRKIFQEKYATGKHKWFFSKLRF